MTISVTRVFFNGDTIRDVLSIAVSRAIELISLDYSISFQCHNVTIMKNAQGDRVIIQEVK